LQTINDTERIGVLLKGNAIYMDKLDVKIAEVHDNAYTISDGRLKIEINVNKL
jgi:hypothetical protein